MKTYRKRHTKRSRNKGKSKSKGRTRKLRGGFFSDLSYFMSRGASLFNVGAPVASGNPGLPVKPFPHSQ